VPRGPRSATAQASPDAGESDAPVASAPRKPRTPRKAKKRASDPASSGAAVTSIDGIVIPPKPPLPTSTHLPQGRLDDIVVPPKPPLPTSEPEPESGPEPEPVLAPQPEPEPEPGPELEPEREPEPEPGPEPEPELEPEPEPEEEAGPVPEDVPAQESDARGEVVPEAIEAEPQAEAPPTAEPHSDVPAVVIRGLAKSFGSTAAVGGIDLTVPAGAFYGILGPNGAGKTTTLSMISGLLRPDQGSIEIGGVDLRRHPREISRMIGVLPDRLRTFDRLTGRQLLFYTGMLRGLDAGIVNARIADLARAFDMVEALRRPVSDYSAGMTKKVMLAGALLHSPRLLVLDEPFEAVDPVSSAVILEILTTYVDHGGTVILSSHGMELIERVCARVAVIVAGQVLAEGSIDEVRGELTLEQRFLQLAGGLSDVEGLEWLHGFSD